jgi:hypothetical protein
MWPAGSNLDDEPNRAYRELVKSVDAPHRPPSRPDDPLTTALRKVVVVLGLTARRSASILHRRKPRATTGCALGSDPLRTGG